MDLGRLAALGPSVGGQLELNHLPQLAEAPGESPHHVDVTDVTHIVRFKQLSSMTRVSGGEGGGRGL